MEEERRDREVSPATIYSFGRDEKTFVAAPRSILKISDLATADGDLGENHEYQRPNRCETN